MLDFVYTPFFHFHFYPFTPRSLPFVINSVTVTYTSLQWNKKALKAVLNMGLGL